MFLETNIDQHILPTLASGITLLLLSILAYYAKRTFNIMSSLPGRVTAIEDRLERDADATREFRLSIFEDRRQAELKVSDLEKRYAGLEGWIKGVHNVPLDKPVTDINPKEVNA